MKKLLAMVLSVLMIALAFTGCAKAKDTAQGTVSDTATDAVAVIESNESADIADVADAAVEEAQQSTNNGVDADTASAFYTAYVEGKSAVLNKLMDGLSNNQDTMMSALSFLGVSLSDLYLLPAMYFGLGETSVATALSMMGAKDVTYDEQGNAYTITYKNASDQQSTLIGTYEKGKSLLCVGSTNGVENVFAETYLTSFGYVSQFYSIAEDGTTTLYQIAINGENGAFGIVNNSDRPATLTGGESTDFPKSAKEWYDISGSTITGVNSEGKPVNFEYVPSEGN